jgi:hypothetical protein
MTKVARAINLKKTAEEVYKPEMDKLKKAVNVLAERVRILEKKIGSVPVDAEVIDSGPVLNKKKEILHASKSEG